MGVCGNDWLRSRAFQTNADDKNVARAMHSGPRCMPLPGFYTYLYVHAGGGEGANGITAGMPNSQCRLAIVCMQLYCTRGMCL